MKTVVNRYNPTLGQDEIFCDVEAHEFEGRLYLYGTCKGCDRFRVWSTDDMEHWTEHGDALTLQDVTFTKATGLWAPDCACKDGQYYLYYSLPQGEMGVAVSDRPYGPFRDLGRVEGVLGIDPCVLADDDGAYYLYWGQRDHVRAARLNDDMRSVDARTVCQPLTVAEHAMHEGSSVRKHGGRYYYVYTETHRRNKATVQGYSVSDSPLSGFRYRGAIVDCFACDPQSWNDHGCIQQFRGQWYIFYHRATQGIYGWGNPRQLCIERIAFDENGEIAEVIPTSSGLAESIPATEALTGGHACEVMGGAYTAPDPEREGILTLKAINDHTGAIVRWLSFHGERRAILEMKGEGACRVEIYLDGRYHADQTLPLGIFFEPFEIEMPNTTGTHEVTLKFFGLFRNATLAGLRFE